MSSPTPTQALATTLLGEDVIAWATRMRADGEPSWRSIAIELRKRTGGQVELTGEIVRRWVVTAAETKAVAS